MLPMRERREATHGTKAMHGADAAPRALGRRSIRKVSLVIGMLGLLVFFGGAQASWGFGGSTPTIEKIEPTSGCPGQVLTLTGKNFGSTGTATSLQTNPAFPYEVTTSATVTSSTKATTIAAIFLNLGEYTGTVALKAKGGYSYSNKVNFTWKSFQSCFGGEGGTRPDRTDRTGR